MEVVEATLPSAATAADDASHVVEAVVRPVRQRQAVGAHAMLPPRSLPSRASGSMDTTTFGVDSGGLPEPGRSVAAEDVMEFWHVCSKLRFFLSNYEDFSYDALECQSPEDENGATLEGWHSVGWLHCSLGKWGIPARFNDLIENRVWGMLLESGVQLDEIPGKPRRE